MSGPEEASDVVAFGAVVGQWMKSIEDEPLSVTFTTLEGEPCVVFQVPEDWPLARGIGAIHQLIAVCVRGFDATDGGVDRATAIILNEDHEENPGAIRWHVHAEVARAYRAGELTDDELQARVDETQERFDDVGDLELDL